MIKLSSEVNHDGTLRHLGVRPAGSGKSTFCSALIAHAQSLGRNVHLFQSRPAAGALRVSASIDIKELISLEDVMEEMNLGPNGGLIYCFE